MNQQEKYVCQLQKKARQRKKDGVFIVEGIKMFLELPNEQIKKVFVSESFVKDSRNKKVLEKSPYIIVKDAIFSDLSDTKTPQGILAIAKQYNYELSDLWKSSNPLILILDTIQDPGNLGTMMRAGEAVGVSGILMNQETVDMYNPKVIRSTMGSLYRIPFYYAEDLNKAVEEIKKQNIKIYAAHLKGKSNYDKIDYKKACAFMIGNESKGLQEKVACLADEYVKIPMCGEVESLNAAIAFAALGFEAARQRRN